MPPFRCPRPEEWNRVYQELKRAHRAAGGVDSVAPPTPLTLGGWSSSPSEMHRRWTETVEWATAHGLGPVVTSIPPDGFTTCDDDGRSWNATLDEEREGT